MNDFFAALANPDVPFIRNALFVGLLSSIPFGIIGSITVVKRMTYIAGAVSHSVLGGIGLALYLGTVHGVAVFSPMAGAFFFALFVGGIISYAVISKHERLDTIIGIVWATGMALGLLLFSITPGYVDPMSYLFGNILLTSHNDLYLILGLNLLIISATVVFYNQLLAVAFDEEFARVRGVNVTFFQTLTIMLISLTVLLMITMVGIVMVIALLTIPPAIAGLLTVRLKNMMALSAVFCMVITAGGLMVSFAAHLPTGSVTILLAGVLYLFVMLGKKFLSRLNTPA